MIHKLIVKHLIKKNLTKTNQ